MRYLYIKNVMTLRTPEQLKAMFQQSRERKQKERQQHKQERQQQYQLLCKAADQLLKETIRDEKKKKMEQLYTLSEKCRQKPLKQPYINLDTNRWIDDTNYTRDYTREDLERMCPNCINWEKWNEVVEATRQQLGITPKEIKHKKKKTRLWTYDTTGNLINEYIDCSAAAREFGVSLVTIYSYMTKQKTIKGITFSNRPLTI